MSEEQPFIPQIGDMVVSVHHKSQNRPYKVVDVWVSTDGKTSLIRLQGRDRSWLPSHNYGPTPAGHRFLNGKWVKVDSSE